MNSTDFYIHRIVKRDPTKHHTEALDVLQLLQCLFGGQRITLARWQLDPQAKSPHGIGNLSLRVQVVSHD